MCKHLRMFLLTGKKVKNNDDYFIKETCLLYNHSSDFDDFLELASNNIDIKVTLMEFLLIESKSIYLNYVVINL